MSSLLSPSLPFAPPNTPSKYDQLAAIGVKGTANIKRFVGRDQTSAPSAYVLDLSYYTLLHTLYTPLYTAIYTPICTLYTCHTNTCTGMYIYTSKKHH